MLRGDEVTRDLLAELIRGAVDDTVRQQIQRRAQEAPISSKVTASLEARLNGYQLNGYEVSVVAQDFPDRGYGSLEHKSGADLYIAIRVQPPAPLPAIAKGLLIQAKKVRAGGITSKRRRLGKGPTREQDFLLGQCEKMVSRSPKGAFVWVYSADGTHVVPATEVLANQVLPPEYLSGRTVGQQFREVLDCFAGDENLVNIDAFESGEALAHYLGEIAVGRGVAINLRFRELLRHEITK